MKKADKMPIQLDKILENIAQEKVLHPNYTNASKKEVDDAWTRVGKNNKLSVHEARSIFKVLQKKYEQEKQKDAPSWKLFNIMEQIHRKEVKVEVKSEEEPPEVPMEEDEEYEMLEVQEEEDQAHAGTAGSTGSTSDGESPTKSNSSTGSPEKDERPLKRTGNAKQAPSSGTVSSTSPGEAKKLLNTMASASPRPPAVVTPQTPSATAAALHKKGITVKKTGLSTPATGSVLVRTNTPQAKNSPSRPVGNMPEVGKTLQLPDSLKRKLSEDQPSTPQVKKIQVGAKTPSPQVQHTTTAQLMQVKQDREDQLAQAQQASAAHGINLITIPANPTQITNGGVGGPSSSTAATVASTSTNGFSPRIEELDFRNDIIFDSSAAANGAANNKLNTNSTEIINLGNFDNSLPPTFFKNLCNSSRHEALGLYVANVMNRLRTRSAAKLELGILRAIIDVQSDELEQ